MIFPSAITKQGEIEQAIDKVQRSIGPDVVRIRYEIEQDWSGQWAIFFRILLTDEAVQFRFREVVARVTGELSQELDFQSLGVFPYHNFRRLSEQAALREPAWA